MKMLRQILNDPDSYQLTPKAIDELRQLYRAFETNPFFPISPHLYAEKVLKSLMRRGEITSKVMQLILEDF
ncbi:hypothetical protein MZM67_002444 [Enterococcus faecium]|uniref:hypothetical protein n=1 Tax=Enterococcus TaxID=1350 RepID=UPI000A34C10E|nr:MULTISPECIES: hypothetical protein [Enterococcus]EGP5688989.1 hypothetical protein [Enterococcus faecium]EME7220845.1 hypothetical protein [Enterococcus faecium]EME8087261.1 hypothetical protein [Enterococcus faecium]EME8112454.1 hypothetical protein [Enterococcus faecium]EME8123195.1 hypothetical protein [Enterococcus faecium]